MFAPSRSSTLTLCALALSSLACAEIPELDEQLPDDAAATEVDGLSCQNAQQGDGICEDHRVKFYCP